MPPLWFYFLALLGFGFVIFIHELGHFLFAKLAGVKVEVFSIGFGPKLARRTIGETEYALSLLPFGGYVKMLGQDDNPAAATPDAQEALDPRSFLAASVPWKVAILLGGVLFNLISSYIILLSLAFSGMPVMPPLVGEIIPLMADRAGTMVTTPAERLGLRVGDHIQRVNGETVRSFDDIVTTTLIDARKPLHVQVLRRDGTIHQLPEDAIEVRPQYSFEFGVPTIGILPPEGNRIEAVLAAHDQPANPRPGERLTAIDGETIHQPGQDPLCGQEIHQRLVEYLGRPVRLTLEKDGQVRTTSIIYAGDAHMPSIIGFPVIIERVLPGSPAERAGIKGGDIVMAADGLPMPESQLLVQHLLERFEHGQPSHLQLMRDGATLDITVSGERVPGGRILMGTVISRKSTGRMDFLPPLQDGPSPLQRAGLRVGDSIVAIQEEAGSRGTPAPSAQGSSADQVLLQVVHDGSPVTLPMDDATFTLAAAVQPVPFWARWLGVHTKPSVSAQLFGCQVVAIGGTPHAQGLPAGWLRVRGTDGSPDHDVDCHLLTAKHPALLAALQPGDWIIGHTVTATGPALELLRGATEAPHAVSYDPGVAFAFADEQVPYHLSSWREAFTMVNATSYNMVVKSLQLIPRFFRSAEQGGIDPNKSLTGPVGMFHILKVHAQLLGFPSYLKLVGMIGLNLFIVNLLPIPITDGGQLMILLVETVIRRPLPTGLRNLLQWAGLLLVVGLMLYVLGLDLSRLF